MLRLLADEALIGPARAIALQNRHALPDCLHLAATVQAGRTRLVTADPAFHARAAAALPFVELQASPAAPVALAPSSSYRVDPPRNMRRFHRLDVQPDLFGVWLLVQE